MRLSFLATTLFLAGVATAASAESKNGVLDHLLILKTSDARANPVQPASLTNDLTRDDIAAAQKCKDLGPASPTPDDEASIINSCLERNSILNIKVVPSQTPVKAMLK